LKINDFNLKEEIVLFVDEFQYCQKSERIFKNIYDEFKNIKIIASGSSSMDIKNKVQESLA
jgi:predicted AAA+ superfamily ATPase